MFLPDGVHFLYLARLASTRSLELRVGSLESKEIVESLGPVESTVGYADGYLFFVRGGHISGGNLTVQAFDPDRRRLIGEPVPWAFRRPSTPPYQFGSVFRLGGGGSAGVLAQAARLFDLTWRNRGEKVRDRRGARRATCILTSARMTTVWPYPDKHRTPATVAARHLDDRPSRLVESPAA